MEKNFESEIKDCCKINNCQRSKEAKCVCAKAKDMLTVIKAGEGENTVDKKENGYEDELVLNQKIMEAKELIESISR